MVDRVKGGCRAPHPPPPHQAEMYASKWQLPLCVYSVGGIDDNVQIGQVLEGDDLSNFLSIG